MMVASKELKCPHCGRKLNKWETPPASTWDCAFLYVCFNDECPYYVHGWEWMQEKYKAHASYRYYRDPKTGATGPLPVWSQTALKNDIIFEGSNENE